METIKRISHFYGFASGHWGNYFDPLIEHNGKLVKGKGFAYLHYLVCNKGKEFHTNALATAFEKVDPSALDNATVNKSYYKEQRQEIAPKSIKNGQDKDDKNDRGYPESSSEKKPEMGSISHLISFHFSFDEITTC